VTVNRFFSPVVRIQAERGHQVIRRGPYGFIRHPGYSGYLLAAPGLSLALGSWLSLLPALLVCLLIARRTMIEDRYLHDHLGGYPAYANDVRYRLLSGVW
jgi:protein-S-isoprenylcysteine O-methyltransferase Ste14